MANQIRLKRGSGSDPGTSDLAVGEIAIRTDNGKLFTKRDNGSVTEITGGGGIDDGDKGDITVSNSGATFTIDAGVIANGNIASNAAIDVSKLTGVMPLAGGVFSGDVTFFTGTTNVNILFDKSESKLQFSDDVKATFGDSDDLQIFHNGSNTFLTNASTGGFLHIRSGSGINLQDDTGDENFLKCIDNGAVELYHNSNKKFETTSSGATVTGTLVATAFTGALTGNVTGNASGSSGSCTGNAATATALETARNIGGVSFDGTGNINLPGVNTSGNQNTSGNAATATALANARTIAGVSFDGTSNISLNNNAITNGAGYITGSGNAATATKLATARTIAGVSFDGSANISLNNNAITNGAGYITSADGGNAATLDGIDSSQFARSDANDTLSGVITLSSSSNDCLNFSASGNIDNRGIAFNNRTALSADSSDGYLRLNNQSEFGNGVYTPLVMRADGGFNVDGVTVVDGSANVIGGRVSGTVSNATRAENLGGASPSVGASNGTIVQRHSSGYIFANFFNTTPNDVSSGITKICVETGNDGYIRHGTAAAVRSFLNVASGANAGLPTTGGTLTGTLNARAIVPTANNTYALGTASARWSDVFTADFHLSNKGSSNQVDNTWGDFTIQEGKDDLFLLNNRNGKMYKFMLQEVS